MARSIAQIVADNRVSEDELRELMERFDTNGDGKLEGAELRSFAAEVAPLVGSSVDDLTAILDFYQHDADPALSPAEVRSFLEIHV